MRYFKTILAILFFLLSLSQASLAYQPKASQVKTDTSSFDGCLNSSDNDVQKSLDTLDDCVSASSLSALSDVGTSTATAGNIFVGTGTEFNAVDLDGDVTIDSTGTATITTDAVDGTDISLSSEDHGDIMYFDGTDWVRLAAGTSGQFLQTQGTDVDPQWATVAVGATDLDDLGDVGTSTATAGNLFIGTGTEFNAVDMEGDATIDSTGTITVNNAATADALTNNPGDCSGGQFANAIAANGDLACATPTDTGATELSGLSDVGTSTATAGNIFVGTGTEFNAVDLDGDVTIDVTGTATITDDVIVVAKFANEDWGDMSVSGNSVTLDNDVVAPAEMADADHGDVSWSGGVASVDDGAIQLDELGDVGTSTATAGNIFVGTGTEFNAVDLDGDVTIDSTGTATITTNAVDGTDISLSSEDHGDIMYFDGTDWVRLAAGTSGQVLETQGTDADPRWTTVAGGVTDLDDLVDVGTSTATAGNILVGTGTEFNAVDLDGDVTIDATGTATVNNVQCTSCISDGELVSDYLLETELDAESELEAQLVDVTNVYTNNDGLLVADLDDLSDVGTSTATAGNLLIGTGTEFNAVDMDGDATIDSTGTITVNNAATADAFTNNPGDCSGGQFANAIAANGDLTCATPTDTGATELSGLSDVGTSTATAGNIFVGTGAEFNAVDLDGDVTIDSTGTATITDDVILSAKFGDEDWGDMSVSGNSVTLDNDVVAPAEMADADHGDVSWSGGVASVDDGAVQLDELGDVGTSTATAGNIFVGSGTEFNAVDIEGDATIDNTGSITVDHSEGIKHRIDFHIANPNGYFTNIGDSMEIFVAPSALTVTKIGITLDTSAHEVNGDFKWADTYILKESATVINDFDTTLGVRTDTSISAGAVAVDKHVYFVFDTTPNAAIGELSGYLQFNFDD